jgi:hypothetical protein
MPARAGLDLGRVGAALPQAGDADVCAGSEHGLGDAGDGERSALASPDGAGVAAVHIQPHGEELAGADGTKRASSPLQHAARRFGLVHQR